MPPTKRAQADPTELTDEQKAEESKDTVTAYIGQVTASGYALEEDQKLGGDGKPTLNEVEVEPDLLAEYRELKADYDSMQSQLQNLYGQSVTPEAKEEDLAKAKAEMEGKEATELTSAQQAEAKANEGAAKKTAASSR